MIFSNANTYLQQSTLSRSFNDVYAFDYHVTEISPRSMKIEVFTQGPIIENKFVISRYYTSINHIINKEQGNTKQGPVRTVVTII